MMYEMDKKNKMPAIPSRAYFDGILKGYLDNNMDPRPLLRSLRKVKEEYRRQTFLLNWDSPYEQNGHKTIKKKNKDYER